jgi:hypothetical protein
MSAARSSEPALEAILGYAADSRGNGVLYAHLSGARAKRLVRLSFRVGVAPPFSDRAIGYAALTALCRALRKRGVREAHFVLADSSFVDEIATGREVGETMAIPYVRLRCVLNTFAKFGVRTGATDDLTQRARAEAALNVAA